MKRSPQKLGTRHWPLRKTGHSENDPTLLEKLESGHNDRVLHFSQHSLQTTRREGNLVVQIDKDTGEVRKVVSFNPDSLNEFGNVMFGTLGTVWSRPHVLWHVLYVVITGFLVAGLSTYVCLNGVDPKKMKYDSFSMCTTMLGAFLGFIFATFVNSTFLRWRQVINFIFTYFEQIKELQFELTIIHGVDSDAWERIRRWSVLSLWIATREAPEMWDEICWDQEFDQWEMSTLMTKTERKLLDNVAKSAPTKRALLVWKWIGNELSELANAGSLPPKISPAFVQIIQDCMKAREAIGMLESVIFLQMPYIYVHLLALLINLFSVLNAIQCGLGMGVHIARLIRDVDDYDDVVNDTMSVVAFLLVLVVAPLIYQTSLSVSLELSLPFGRTSADLPMSTLIAMQEIQLQQVTDFPGDPLDTSGSSKDPNERKTQTAVVEALPRT